tara:strand:- start:1697 stop:2482 length:786 start_codon:yes stop_codon:yes gene_type:complete
MDRLVRRIGGMNKTFLIYKQKEADDEGISYTHWKEANAGQYALTDDKYVGKCVGKKEYYDKQGRCRTFIKLCCGVGWVGKASTILYEANKEFNMYSQVKPDYWVRKEIKSTRFKNAVTAYVAQLLSPNAIDWDVIGDIYRPDQKTPAATVRRLFKQQEVREVIEDKLKSKLAEKGITQEMVLDLHLESIEMSRVKRDPSNMMRVTESLMDLLEMKPGKRIVTETMEIGLSSGIADQIESEEKRIKLSQKTEEPIEADPRDS